MQIFQTHQLCVLGCDTITKTNKQNLLVIPIHSKWAKQIRRAYTVNTGKHGEGERVTVCDRMRNNHKTIKKRAGRA